MISHPCLVLVGGLFGNFTGELSLKIRGIVNNGPLTLLSGLYGIIEVRLVNSNTGSTTHDLSRSPPISFATHAHLTSL
jgi:hypothetical protein